MSSIKILNNYLGIPIENNIADIYQIEDDNELYNLGYAKNDSFIKSASVSTNIRNPYLQICTESPAYNTLKTDYSDILTESIQGSSDWGIFHPISFSTFSVSYWFKGSTTDIWLFGNSENFKIKINSLGKLELYNSSNNSLLRSSTNSFNDNNWHNIIIINDSSTSNNFKIYIDKIKEINYFFNTYDHYNNERYGVGYIVNDSESFTNNDYQFKNLSSYPGIDLNSSQMNTIYNHRLSEFVYPNSNNFIDNIQSLKSNCLNLYGYNNISNYFLNHPNIYYYNSTEESFDSINNLPTSSIDNESYINNTGKFSINFDLTYDGTITQLFECDTNELNETNYALFNIDNNHQLIYNNFDSTYYTDINFIENNYNIWITYNYENSKIEYYIDGNKKLEIIDSSTINNTLSYYLTPSLVSNFKYFNDYIFNENTIKQLSYINGDYIYPLLPLDANIPKNLLNTNLQYKNKVSFPIELIDFTGNTSSFESSSSYHLSMSEFSHINFNPENKNEYLLQRWNKNATIGNSNYLPEYYDSGKIFNIYKNNFENDNLNNSIWHSASLTYDNIMQLSNKELEGYIFLQEHYENDTGSLISLSDLLEFKTRKHDQSTFAKIANFFIKKSKEKMIDIKNDDYKYNEEWKNNNISLLNEINITSNIISNGSTQISDENNQTNLINSYDYTYNTILPIYDLNNENDILTNIDFFINSKSPTNDLNNENDILTNIEYSINIL